MASKLIQVQSKACEASKFVAKHGTSYYRQLHEKNKHFIQEPATVDKCQELSKQLLYTRLARSLPSLLPSLCVSQYFVQVSGLYVHVAFNLFTVHLVHAGIS
ncbi:hypothetical protein F2Q68_00006702 [Brassica cretica]|uniref:Uncharacterized protein n=1 Tax=Brassica cretica TaxID=69181 RepID=A0A8S9JDN0_BRACR|nr:hypothetical protein F2Q68_00006702 [Brassica cretica]